MFKLFKKKKKVQIPVLPEAFENSAYKALSVNYDNFFDNFKNMPEDEKICKLENVKRISFELSNLCNYSCYHKKCPLSLVKEKKTLDSDIFYKCIDELSCINYSGVIAFHRYNEPLIDPRLFKFIEYTNAKIPDAKILILTNGFYLTDEILRTFETCNIWCICVSAYFKNEYERLIRLNTSIPLRVFFSILDDRESIYESDPKGCKAPCFSPLSDLTVSSSGEVGLCCLDWKDMFTFGNLKELSLSQVVSSDRFKEVCKDLQQGKRKLLICRNCDWAR